jgi:hypothetical protein
MAHSLHEPENAPSECKTEHHKCERDSSSPQHKVWSSKLNFELSIIMARLMDTAFERRRFSCRTGHNETINE